MSDKTRVQQRHVPYERCALKHERAMRLSDPGFARS
jgi:hypothetical protein